MRQVVTDIVRRLNLNYEVTLVSRGESGRCEIVMWDRPRDSYFSIRLRWRAGRSLESLAEEIEHQLRQRVAALNSGAVGLGDRRPRRPSNQITAGT